MSASRFIILLYLFTPLLSSDIVRDNELWSSVGLEKNLSRHIEAELELEYRLKENYTRFKNSFIETTLSYNLGDSWSLFGAYRYYIAEDEDRRRISIGSSVETQLLFISIKYRVKLQHDIESERDSSSEFRNRFTVEIPLRINVKPYISTESFHLRSSSTYRFDEYRLTAGIRFDLCKEHSLKLFYTYKETDITSNEVDITDITGVQYEYDFNSFSH